MLIKAATYFLFTTFLVFAQTQINNIKYQISSNNIKKHLNFLANDVLEGRATGSIGASLSAKYLAIRYEEYNLKPIGDNSTYYQYVPMHSNKPLIDSELTFIIDSNKTNLKLNADYLLYGAGNRSYIPSETELIFVGYGIIAPEFDYNDYEDINVEGKIAVIYDGEPASEDDNYFEGLKTTIYSYPASKQRLALSRGAAGTIIIPNDENLIWENKVREFSFEDINLAYSVTTGLNIMINPEFVSLLFENSGFKWEVVKENIRKGQMKSFSLEPKITFKGSFVSKDFVGQNVIGLIEGANKDYHDNPIIVTAHYDHLGIGLPVNADSIYNGAFDNALGCAVLLELARLLSENDHYLKRPIVFLLVTGEEKGLLGSRYYLDHPVFPLYKTAANINIDGVPFIDNFNSIIPFGYEFSTIKENIDRVTDEMNLKIDQLPEIFSDSETFNRSDQIAFANAGIPSMLIMDGINYKNVSYDDALRRIIEYTNSIYHTPFDDLSQEINFDAVEQYVELLYKLIIDISNDKENPEWFSGVPYRSERLRSIAEKR